MNWTEDELKSIAAADELHLSTTREDGTLRHPVTIWVVRVADDLFVRAVDGPTGKWFSHATTSRRGRIAAGGVTKDVAFLDVAKDDGQITAIDEAYQTKYRRYGPSIVSSTQTPKAQAATLRLEPAPPGEA